jgi:hypothetical protein
MRHLQGGGRVLLGAPNVTEAVWDTPLYRDTLGLEYVRRWDRGFEFSAVGAKEIAAEKKFSLELATKRDSIAIFQPIELVKDGGPVSGVEPFLQLPDGQWIGAKIARRDAASGKDYRAVVLGFFLADVKGAEERRVLLAEALRFLEGAPTDVDLSAAAASAPSKPVDAPEAPAGSTPVNGGG